MLRLLHKLELCRKSTIFLLSFSTEIKQHLTQRSNSNLFTVHIQYKALCNYPWRHFLNQCTVSSNSHLKQLMVTSFPLHGGLFSPMLRGLTLILVWHGYMMHIFFDCWPSCLSEKGRKKKEKKKTLSSMSSWVWKTHGVIRQRWICYIFVYWQGGRCRRGWIKVKYTKAGHKLVRSYEVSLKHHWKRETLILIVFKPM